MRNHLIWKLVLILAMAPVALSLGGPNSGLRAQDAAPAKKKAASPRGRLPAYYNQVVSGDQRKKIYDIQGSYAPKIEALQAQLDALVKERDAEVAAVLTDEQRKRVDELTAEAAKRREEARAARAAQK